MMVSYVTIGRNIRKARRRKGLTQEEMAETCEMSAVHYGRLERGQRRISLEWLAKIADVLCVPMDVLLSGMTMQAIQTENMKRNRIGLIIDYLCAGCSDEACGMMLDVCTAIARRDKFGKAI